MINDKLKGFLKKAINIQNLEDAQFETEEYEVLLHIWEAIRDDNTSVLREVENILGELDKQEKYESIISFIKKENKEYYDFDFFRNDNVSFEDKVFIMENIFKNSILINNIEKLKELTKDFLPNEILKSITRWIGSLVSFCIENNLPGNKIQDILFENYRISKEISKILSDLYNQNLIMLKLNFIIEIMEIRMNDKEEF